MPDPPTTTPRTGLQLLIDWANEQDHWVRAIVTEVIAVRRALADASVAAAYDMLLAEKGLSQAAPPNVAFLSAGATAADVERRDRLTVDDHLFEEQERHFLGALGKARP